MGTSFLIIFVVIYALVFSGTTQNFDSNLATLINQHSLGNSLTQVVVYATMYGREYFWTALVGLMLLFGKRNTKLLALELTFLFLVAILTGEISKALAPRPRPFETLGSTLITLRAAPEYDSSFPSGHALIVSAGAFFTLLTFRRKAVAVVLTAEAAIVAYSRIYVGLHYPLDVTAGVFIGGAVVFLGLYVLRKYLGRKLDRGVAFTEKLLRVLHFPEVF